MGGISALGLPPFDMAPLDWVVLAILLLAALRGLFQGLIREVFSIAALGGACIAARLWTAPAADWLVDATGGGVAASAAPWLAGGLIALAALCAVVLAGRLLRRGAHAAGLGWADRLAGGALGTAEGALVAGFLLVGISWIVGHGHPILTESRSAMVFAQLQVAVQEQSERLPNVAAPAR
ncbi:MAG: CvpA family protein [Myxococcota bacterium]